MKLSLLGALLLGAALRGEAAADVLLTLPFENVSGRAEYNWVGESFVVLYADLLASSQFTVIDPVERNLVYEKLGLRPSDLLTRAAVIRVAEAAQANLALVGNYDIGGEAGNATIAISARLIEVGSGRLVGNKVFTRSGLLNELQAMQGELAWNILYERNRATALTKEQVVGTAKSIPPRAYESYVKGIQTRDAKVRELLLRRAIQEYESGGAPNHFAQAVYELGMVFFRQGAYADASAQFRSLTATELYYAESQFYLGLAAQQLGNTLEAATAFERLAELAPLPEILNNAGAMWCAKGDAQQGLNLLRRAVVAQPAELSYRFNLGYALWKTQSFAEAAQPLRIVAERAPNDGEALFLLAKSLESAGNAAEAAKVDDQAKRVFPHYARWAVAPDKIPSLFRLKQEFKRASFNKLLREQAGKQATAAPATPAKAAANLDRVRQLIEARNDAEALSELQKILEADAAQAEAHYLRGLVLQRRNEAEGALSAFQAAAYWNPRHFAAHLALSRSYLARNDRALALTHARQALLIEPQNRDAIALKQQIETGR